MKFYVYFKGDTPQHEAAGGIEEKEALPNEDIREFDSHEAFSEQYTDSPMAIPGFSGDAGIDLLEDHVPAQPSLSKLNALRRVGIRDIERAANDYQTKVVGTVDTERKLRFQLNLEAAKAYKAESASAPQTQMLLMQLQANHEAEHHQIKDMDIDQFVDWIIEYETLTLLGAGLIESILITGRAAVWKANSQAEINAILGGLVEQANTAYQQLTGS